MKIKYNGSVQGTRLEMEQLNKFITEAQANSTTLLFTLIGGTEFSTKFNSFIGKDDAYQNNRQKAQQFRQASIPLLKKLHKYNRDIARYIKTQNLENTKKLSEWGIPNTYGKYGKVQLVDKIKDIKLASKSILAKHDLDAANSILTEFDMADMQTTLDAYELTRENYNNHQHAWRGYSQQRREDIAELRRMQHLIARELLSIPTFNPRDLELMGYTLTEFHQNGENETPIVISA